jgi:hypothetical protein
MQVEFRREVRGIFDGICGILRKRNFDGKT